MIIGIDVGKSQVKVFSGGGKLSAIYPSLIGEGKLSTIDGNTVSNLTYLGKNYIVGEDARLATLKWSMDDKKATLSTLLHVLYVIANYCREDSVQIGVGLPAGNYEYEKVTLKESLSGRHIFRANEEERVIEILPYVIPEGLGAYCSFVLDDDGNPVSEGGGQKYVLVVDIGYKTLDTVLVDGTKVSLKGWKSSFLGTGVVLQKVVNLLTPRFGIILPEEIALLERTFFTDGKSFFLRGETINISPELEAATEDASQAVIEYVSHTLRETAAEDIIFVGGGSLLFKPFLQKKFSSATFPTQSALIANAKGFYKLVKRASRKAGKESEVAS